MIRLASGTAARQSMAQEASGRPPSSAISLLPPKRRDRPDASNTPAMASSEGIDRLRTATRRNDLTQNGDGNFRRRARPDIQPHRRPYPQDILGGKTHMPQRLHAIGMGAPAAQRPD